MRVRVFNDRLRRYRIGGRVMIPLAFRLSVTGCKPPCWERSPVLRHSRPTPTTVAGSSGSRRMSIRVLITHEAHVRPADSNSTPCLMTAMLAETYRARGTAAKRAESVVRPVDRSPYSCLDRRSPILLRSKLDRCYVVVHPLRVVAAISATLAVECMANAFLNPGRGRILRSIRTKPESRFR
jgi:hypothetical protein